MLKMMNKIVLSAGLLFWSCAGQDQKGATTEGIVLSDELKWPRGVIPVCWSAPGMDAKKRFVENLITTEIEFKSNVRFTGWNDVCPGQPPPNKVQIIVVDSRPLAVQGYNGFNQYINLNLSFSDTATWPSCQSEQGKRACKRNFTLHEFMHTAGVVHEHERTDTTCFRPDEGVHPNTRAVGAFDNNSIMNYCHPTFFRNELSLSQGDIESLRVLYPQASTPQRTPPTAPVTTAPVTTAPVTTTTTATNTAGLDAKLQALAVNARCGFDANHYLDANSDLRPAGVTTGAQALTHYTRHGIAEGRPGGCPPSRDELARILGVQPLGTNQQSGSQPNINAPVQPPVQNNVSAQPRPQDNAPGTPAIPSGRFRIRSNLTQIWFGNGKQMCLFKNKLHAGVPRVDDVSTIVDISVDPNSIQRCPGWETL